MNIKKKKTLPVESSLIISGQNLMTEDSYCALEFKASYPRNISLVGIPIYIPD